MMADPESERGSREIINIQLKHFFFSLYCIINMEVTQNWNFLMGQMKLFNLCQKENQTLHKIRQSETRPKSRPDNPLHGEVYDIHYDGMYRYIYQRIWKNQRRLLLFNKRETKQQCSNNLLQTTR